MRKNCRRNFIVSQLPALHGSSEWWQSMLLCLSSSITSSLSSALDVLSSNCFRCFPQKSLAGRHVLFSAVNVNRPSERADIERSLDFSSYPIWRHVFLSVSRQAAVEANWSDLKMLVGVLHSADPIDSRFGFPEFSNYCHCINTWVHQQHLDRFFWS